MHNIQVKNLSFSYGDEKVLDDINMEIEAGDFVCLLGQSGCGKSTFLRLMAGLSKADSGSILIGGEEVGGASLERGVVFQDYSLFPWFTTGKNIMLALRQKYPRESKKALKERALYFLNEVGLDSSTFDKLPKELSGGMQQRCAICRAFALDPPILLMDEPFGALDAVTRAKLQDMILHLWKKDHPNRKTILFVTHDVEEALFLANKIFVFGSSPSKIIYQHTFGEKSKLSRETLFENKEYIDLRTNLLRILNKDIEAKISESEANR